MSVLEIFSNKFSAFSESPIQIIQEQIGKLLGETTSQLTKDIQASTDMIRKLIYKELEADLYQHRATFEELVESGYVSKEEFQKLKEEMIELIDTGFEKESNLSQSKKGKISKKR
jgi:uncharacterized protein YutE (UPF0331/DUF86 family)